MRKVLRFFGTRYLSFSCSDRCFRAIAVLPFPESEVSNPMFPGIEPLHSVIDPAKPKDAACPA